MIVKTLLDTDLYKFTTSYAYIKLFPYAMGTFSFSVHPDLGIMDEMFQPVFIADKSKSSAGIKPLYRSFYSHCLFLLILFSKYALHAASAFDNPRNDSLCHLPFFVHTGH